MAKIQIDGVDYDTEVLTDEAKAQLQSLHFCDAELQRLQAEAASIQTARMAYANALKVELNQIGQGQTVAKKAEEPKDAEKKGLFGGLFGKK